MFICVYHLYMGHSFHSKLLNNQRVLVCFHADLQLNQCKGRLSFYLENIVYQPSTCQLSITVYPTIFIYLMVTSQLNPNWQYRPQVQATAMKSQKTEEPEIIRALQKSHLNASRLSLPKPRVIDALGFININESFRLDIVGISLTTSGFPQEMINYRQASS